MDLAKVDLHEAAAEVAPVVVAATELAGWPVPAGAATAPPKPPANWGREQCCRRRSRRRPRRGGIRACVPTERNLINMRH